MAIGGYTVIDLKDTNFSSVPVLVDGIYDRIERCTKPLLLRNFYTSSKHQFSLFTYPVVNGTQLFIQVEETAGGYPMGLLISDNDEVTYGRLVETSPSTINSLEE